MREQHELRRGRQLRHRLARKNARRTVERHELVDHGEPRSQRLECERVEQRLVPERHELLRGRHAGVRPVHLSADRALERHELVDHEQPYSADLLAGDDRGTEQHLVPDRLELLRRRHVEPDQRTRRHPRGALARRQLVDHGQPRSQRLELRRVQRRLLPGHQRLLRGRRLRVPNGAGGSALVERTNGSSWAVVSSPIPSGATGAELLAVSCPSTTSCDAVGFAETDPTAPVLTEHWNGTNWSLTNSADPSGANTAQLSGVSCPNTTRCYSVGSDTAHGGTFTLAAEYG